MTTESARRSALRGRLTEIQAERNAINDALAKTPLFDVDTIRALASRLTEFNEALRVTAMELESLHEQDETESSRPLLPATPTTAKKGAGGNEEATDTYQRAPRVRPGGFTALDRLLSRAASGDGRGKSKQ